ncbi:TIGR04283 family arsenosugar biosynthesis glycosyltransferase [Fulvivirgaceae bacterium BMA10]|uniref:TIGR04283 family arsenosugar biosynthesis glycosyltransferase n=1 Tax=Splendidivirga corallicola TaxID=3051826 RepID=A0ABT8KTI3_9BACT|nr:TIGR04283 family arsenosugar biosynthesis glycosyltransferase [Fulvivirgaceae bacterium BMA10]
MSITIIVPTYNEFDYIQTVLKHINAFNEKDLLKEIIVVDAGSSDGTMERAEINGAKIIRTKLRGRALQMNVGAREATGDILYFLHADTLPPKDFLSDINAVVNNGFSAGCFRLTFDWSHWFLKFNAYFTRFDINAFRYGDQSLFIKRDLFNRIHGFNEQFTVLEDNEIIRRIKKKGTFKIFKKSVITSARKYRRYGVYRLQITYYFIYLLYKLGFSQKKLMSIYQSLLN